MTKGYVCVECGSQIVGHSKTECDAGRSAMLFENWWNETGRYLDPDTDDVPWFDKRKELAELAYVAGRESLEELRSLLRRSLQLPRPWIDGGITWEKWNELFADIEKAVAK